MNSNYLRKCKQWKQRKCLAVVALTCSGLLEKERHSRGKTRKWIKRRETQGFFQNIVRELIAEDTQTYREMMRMTYSDFLGLVGVIEPYITPRQVVGGNKIITAAERLTLTIRYLATGESYRSLSFQFRISISGISYIISDVCKAIVDHLGSMYLKVPSSQKEWLEIALKFEEKWNLSNCVGAIDGKHIVMQPPANAGSYYYNYKNTHFIVLMAVAGPGYECLYADVDTNGRISDGGVFNKCGLAKSIDDGTISLPPPKCLPFGVIPIPFVFLGDDAFALKPNIMKPYPQKGLTEDKRIYNYRHSSVRRLSENLFGILANRWRVFTSAIMLSPEKIETLAMAALVLHNYLRSTTSKSCYCPVGLVDNQENGSLVPGRWREESPSESFLPLAVSRRGHNPSKNAKCVRDTFKEYFFAEGSVDWQWNYC